MGRFVTEQPPYSILARGVEADLLPTAEKHGMGVLPWSPLAGGWLSGQYRKGQDVPMSHRADRMPARYDLDDPVNQAKLDAADALADLAEKSGLTLVHMALAFTLAHPAVIGTDHRPTHDGAPRVPARRGRRRPRLRRVLDSDVLDEIDKIVPPGTTLADFDKGYVPPALQDPFLRRRRTH